MKTINKYKVTIGVKGSSRILQEGFPSSPTAALFFDQLKRTFRYGRLQPTISGPHGIYISLGTETVLLYHITHTEYFMF